MANVLMVRASVSRDGRDPIAKIHSVQMIALGMVSVHSNRHTVLDSAFATMAGAVLVAKELLFTHNFKNVQMIAQETACA
jgi:hypothetical protein